MLASIVLALFMAMLIVVAVVDLRKRIIYNFEIIAIVCLWIVWAALVVVPAVSQDADFLEALSTPFPVTGISVCDSLIAAAVFGLGSLILCVAFERLTGKFAFGGGDIKLLFACGLFLGLEGEAVAVLIACIVCALCGVIFSRARVRSVEGELEGTRDASASGDDVSALAMTLPFGPFIALGCIVAIALRLI